MSLLQLPARALLWLLAPVQVPAPPDDASARWSAPPECPDRSALLTAVGRRLRRPLAAAEVVIDARVAGDARRGYTLHLTLTAGVRSETRDIHDPSCAALTDAAALRVVAVLAAAPVVPPVPADTATAGTSDAAPILSDAAPTTSDAAPILSDAAPPATPTTPTAAPVPAPIVLVPAQAGPAPGDSFEPPGGVLRLHGGGELGAVPGATGAVGLALGLLWPRLRLELQGTMLAPRTAPRPPGTVRAGLFAGAVHGCGRLGQGALEVPLCAGLEIGALRGTASGLPASRAASAWWVAAVLGPGLAWHVRPRISVWASLQLVLAVVRPEFEQGAGMTATRIFRPSAASGRLLVGVELRLRDPW